MIPLHSHNGTDSPKIYVDGIYTGATAVKKTGDESVAGVKTFTSIPILPATNATTDNQMIRKAQADALSIPTYALIASDILRDSANAEDEFSTAAYTKLKEIEHNDIAGTIRIKFSIKTRDGNEDVFGRIYINGSAVGTERSTDSTDYQTYTEDIAVANGDLIQLYCKQIDEGFGDLAYAKDLNLYYIKKLTNIVAGTINLN